MKTIIKEKQGENMKHLVLVSRDKKHMRFFNLNTIMSIYVEQCNQDESRREITIFEHECATHPMKVVSFDFDQFVSFINGSGFSDNLFTITVEEV